MSVASASPLPLPRVEFHLTGFGEFHGVKSNPTEQLASTLPSFLQEQPLPSNVTLASSTVLETSGVGAKEQLMELRRQYAREEPAADAPVAAPAPAAADAPRHRVWLHFGVHAGSQQFKLETTAYNLADFRCADERGWMPCKEPIDPQCGQAQLECQLDLDRVCAALGQCADGRGFRWDVGLSDDPGRFVCNWIFFHSLQCVHKPVASTAPQCTEHALFVHVPQHDVYDLKQQQRFARDVMVEIARSLVEGAAAGAGAGGEEQKDSMATAAGTVVSTTPAAPTEAGKGGAAQS